MSTRRRAEYKLHYFNAKGRGELARLILTYAKVPYDDIRYEREEWPAQKERMPYGQLPVLEWRGQLLAQSNAIARFLARRHNLAGADEWQTAKIDAFVDQIGDGLNEMRPIFYAGEDEEKRKAAVEDFFNNAGNAMFKHAEKQLIDNDTDYVVGNQLSYGDLCLFAVYDILAGMFGEDRLPKCQHVAALHARVAQIPTIRAYLDKRPQTPF